MKTVLLKILPFPPFHLSRSILPVMFALLTPVTAYTASTEMVELLNTIIEKQPEQQIIQGLQEIHTSNQSYSNSWIAGDVDLVVHHENDTLTDNQDYKNWQVGVEFPVWMSGKKQAQKNIARSYGNQLSAHQSYLRWLASEQLRNLVWAYKSAQIEVNAARSALQKSQSLLNKVKLKVKAGESPRIDQLLAHKAVLKQQNMLVQKQSALTITQNRFKRWTRAYKQQAPRVFVGAQNDKIKNSEDNSLIFEVTIPLGVNPGFSSALAEEKSNVYKQQAVLDKAKIQLKQAIFQAQQTLASAKQSIHFSRQQYDISIKALKMSEQAYQLGETDIQNLLLVQQQTADAKLGYQLAQARSGQAIANLNQVTGHILGAQQ